VIVFLVVSFIVRDVSFIFLIVLFPRLVLLEERHRLAPSDPNSLRRGIVGVSCSCPTWYSVPVGKSSRVFLAGAGGS